MSMKDTLKEIVNKTVEKILYICNLPYEYDVKNGLPDYKIPLSREIETLIEQTRKERDEEIVEMIEKSQQKYYSKDKKTGEEIYSGAGQCRSCDKRKDSLEIEDIINKIKSNE